MLALVVRRGSRLTRPGVWRQPAVFLENVNGSSLTETPRSLPAWATRDYKSDGAGKEITRPVAVFSASAWEKCVAPAFRTFLKLNKHMLVPQKFVVRHGDEAWPRETWGYQLGKHTKWLRAQRSYGKEVPEFAKDDLEELDFAWVVSQYKWDYFVMPSLRRFHELHGHTDVVPRFVVPVGNPNWPEQLWGQLLGRTVANIRMHKYFPEQIEASSKELDTMEFCYRTSIHERDWSQRMLPSLQVFRRVFGHCNVGKSFVVPSAEPWPKKAWDIKLGRVVSNMRSNSYYADQVARDKAILEELDFVWSHSEWEWSERILPALQAFRKVHGHCRVPHGFVVPSKAEWPKKAWGLKLGWTVINMRRSGYYAEKVTRDKDILKELGFVWRRSGAE